MPAMLTIVEYRLSRSELRMQRAYRKIASQNRNALRQFQRATMVDDSPFDRLLTNLDRRSAVRNRLQIPAYLAPAIVDGLRVSPGASESLLVVTRDISITGIGMVHDHPLEQDHYIAEFDVMQKEPIRLLLSIFWSRPIDDWSFRSGSQVIGLLRPTRSVD